MRQRLWDLVDVATDDNGLPVIDWFDASMMVLIVLNVLAVIFQTVDSLDVRFGAYFFAFEVFSVAVFTIEYLVRLALCTADPRYKGQIRGRLRLVLSPMGLVDLASILPFYLPLLLPVDLRFLCAGPEPSGARPPREA